VTNGMSDPHHPFDAFRVEQALRAAVPEVLFAAPRIVRRIARADHGMPLTILRAPHREILVIAARRLAAVAEEFWAVPPDLPETVAVVARPDAARLTAAAGARGENAVLRDYWRMAFHALVDLNAPRAVDRIATDDASWHELTAGLGPTGLDEARTVLVHEGLLDAAANDREVFAEFMAVFLELRCFSPSSVAHWFPSLSDPDVLAERLADLIDAEDLLARSLPPMLDPEAADTVGVTTLTADVPQTGWFRRRPAALRRAAERSALRGNLVRATLDEWRAATAGVPGALAAGRGLQRRIEAFAQRLGWALDLDAAGVGDTMTLIRSLVERAGGSSWSPAARLLYDLQKVCVDSERESFRTELLAWAFSLGRRPLATPLPCQRLVLIHRHAVAAADRVPELALPEPMRSLAERLLDGATTTTGAAARETLRPRIAAAIREAGLVPGCLVEDAALEKLIDELLDTALRRGFLPFASVRDAVSRNQVKLPDLRGPGEWLAGDPLLRLDERLAATLDGAYRPAPVYLSLMQRLSAAFFGWSAGRLLTTHVLLPFGGAWIILRGLEHIIEPITAYSLGETWHVYTQARWLALAAALWALIHLSPVRAAAFQTLRGLAAAAHFAGVVLPRRLLRMPVVEALLTSGPVRWFLRHVWSPLVLTVLVWLALPHHGRGVSRGTAWFPPLFFAASAGLLNSRTGRHLQDRVLDGIGRAVHRFHVHVVVGFFSWIVDAFRRAMDFIEGLLYAVDESLRFRSDESGPMLAVKAVLGAVWSIVEAFTRFCITLLIEPQLNPIKHFPVVTVSHKLLVPMIPMVAGQLAAATGMEKGLSFTIVTFISTSIPGVFGFLAWELKENWRLYAANRPGTLRPVPVGPHGETVRRLLMPGFHSGTVPRLFARQRRAHPRGAAGGQPVESVAGHELHELAHDIAVFVDRDVIALVERTPAGERLALRVDGVDLAITRITIRITADAVDAGPLTIELVRRESAIESRITDAGWVERLDGASRETVRLALAGLHRLAAADEATARWASLPDGREAAPAPAEAEQLVPLTPIAWPDWRDAWERERRNG
jgi:hypothetical protein